MLRENARPGGNLVFLQAHHNHAAHAGRKEHLRRRHHHRAGELRQGFDLPRSQRRLQHRAQIVQRQRLVTDEGCHRIQQFIHRRPYLPVPVDAQVVFLGGQHFLLFLQALINPGVRDIFKEQRSGFFAGAGFPRQFFLQFRDGRRHLLPEFLQPLRFLSFPVLFGNMEGFQPPAAVDAVLPGIVFHVHDLFRRHVREAGLDQPQHVPPAEVQPQNPQQRQEILRVSAHQNRLVLLRVEGDAARGKRQRQQRRQRVLLAHRNGHVLPGNARPVPVDQRLAGMLAFQIGVFRVVHADMGHVRNKGFRQFRQGGFPRRTRILPDDICFRPVRVDLLAAEDAEGIEVLFRIGNAGVHPRGKVFPLHGVCRFFAVQEIPQRLDGIVGSPENIAVRADVVADQPDHDLVGAPVPGRGNFIHQVQEIVGNVVKAVDQQPAVPDDPALPDQAHGGHPLAHRILKAFIQNLPVSVPDQRHVLQLGRRAAAGRRILPQETGRQPGPGKVVDLSGDLRGQRRLRHGFPVVFQLVPAVMQHLGDDHVLPVAGDGLPVSAARQFPHFADQRGRRKNLQVKDTAVRALVHDFRFAGQRKGFRNQHHRMGCLPDFFDQARDQSRCPGRHNADARHQTSLLSTGQAFPARSANSHISRTFTWVSRSRAVRYQFICISCRGTKISGAVS